MTTRVEQAASKKKGHRWFAALFDPLNRITGTERHLAKYRPYVTGEAEGRVLEVGAGCQLRLLQGVRPGSSHRARPIHGGGGRKAAERARTQEYRNTPGGR